MVNGKSSFDRSGRRFRITYRKCCRGLSFVGIGVLGFLLMAGHATAHPLELTITKTTMLNYIQNNDQAVYGQLKKLNREEDKLLELISVKKRDKQRVSGASKDEIQKDIDRISKQIVDIKDEKKNSARKYAGIAGKQVRLHGKKAVSDNRGMEFLAVQILSTNRDFADWLAGGSGRFLHMWYDPDGKIRWELRGENVLRPWRPDRPSLRR